MCGFEPQKIKLELSGVHLKWVENWRLQTRPYTMESPVFNLVQLFMVETALNLQSHQVQIWLNQILFLSPECFIMIVRFFWRVPFFPTGSWSCLFCRLDMTSQWISSGSEWHWWGFLFSAQSFLGFPAADTVTCVIHNTPTWSMSRVADEIQCWVIPSDAHEAKQSELCTWKDWLGPEDENRSFHEVIWVLSKSQKGEENIRNCMERNRRDYCGTTVQMQNLYKYWRVCTVLMEVREWELEKFGSLKSGMGWDMK